MNNSKVKSFPAKAVDKQVMLRAVCLREAAFFSGCPGCDSDGQRISISGIPPGVYQVVVQNGMGRGIQRLIILE